MTDAAPALPDAELRETLDLLSTVVASVSDRVDNQVQCHRQADQNRCGNPPGSLCGPKAD